MATETGHAGWVVIAATAAVFGIALGIIAASPAIEAGSETSTYLQLATLVTVMVSIGCALAYALAVRLAVGQGRLTRFDQLLQLRNFAYASMPSGALAVALALVWYVVRRLTGTWGDSGDLDAIIVGIFAGLGAAFVSLMVFLATTFEAKAIRRAREEISAVVT